MNKNNNNSSNRHPIPHHPSPPAVKWWRLWERLKSIPMSRTGNILTLLVIAADILAYKHFHQIIVEKNHIVEGISLVKAEGILLIISIIIIDLLILLMSLIPVRGIRHTSLFRSVGLYNKFHQAPDLICSKRKKGMSIFDYYVRGIAIKDFDTIRPQLETAFNCYIVNITEGRSKNRILMYTRKRGIPKYVPYDNAYMPQNKDEIALGISGNGTKILNLDKSPMIFSGGETGSGKTVLLKTSLYQAYEHGVDIYLYDGKGFVDFSDYETNRYHCIDSKSLLLEKLIELTTTIETRKVLLKDYGYKTIGEFNEDNPDDAPMRRILLATDEIGEIFSKKGLKGADKELVESIEKEMEKIARIGRAFGVHLWLSTQRGDAETIPPQIRSNLTYKVCGKASDVLSRLTLDNGLASEIRADQKGRFVDNEGEFFQAFDFKPPKV